MWRLSILAIAFMGCASAKIGGGSGGGGDGGITVIDGDPDDPDARPIDAPDAPPPIDGALALTMTQTTNSTMIYGQSVACGIAGQGTSDNVWYRAFQLSDYPAITGAFHITGISFAVQEATPTTVTVKVNSYTGPVGGATIDTTQISSLAFVNQAVGATSGQTGETIVAPFDVLIPAGGKFVVEILAPDLTGQGGIFYIGATSAGESKPSYLTSTGCNITVPKATTAVLQSAGQMIIDVVGTH